MLSEFLAIVRFQHNINVILHSLDDAHLGYNNMH